MSMTEREALKLALEVMRNNGDVSVDEWIATEKAIKETLAQPQRKPLTDEEVWEALGGIDCTRPMLIARAIEAAHGIKVEA